MSTITTIGVTGMTCGHCVSAVTKELESLAGVGRVTVTLDTEGTSEVTVLSEEPLAEAAVREAIDEAGYDVAAMSSHGPAEEFGRLAQVRESLETAGPGPQAIEIISKDEAGSTESAGGCGCGGCGCGA